MFRIIAGLFNLTCVGPQLYVFFWTRCVHPKSDKDRYVNVIPIQDLETRNDHVQYEFFIIYFKRLRTLSFFYCCKNRSGVKVKRFGKNRKILWQRICMWNIKALALTVQMLLERFKLSNSMTNSKVKVTG